MENLESYFSKIKDQLTSKEDSLAVLIHRGAIFNKFQCVGIGKNWPSNTEVINSDIPPVNWNSDQRCYLFRYLDDKKNRFLLKIAKKKQPEYLVINLKNVDANVSCETWLKVDEYAGDSFNEFKTAYNENVKTFDDMMKCLIISVMESVEQKSKAK